MSELAERSLLKVMEPRLNLNTPISGISPILLLSLEVAYGLSSSTDFGDLK